MKRKSILICEGFVPFENNRISATIFTSPGPVSQNILDPSIHFGDGGISVTMQNLNILNSNIVKCSSEDTYDFEVGALIALMKMCGVEKVVRACNEAFSEDTFKTYAIKYERELNELKKDSDKVIDELIEENKKLKLDCEKLQRGYIDTYMIFCGGRQNGKQYTALVNMFKKLDQKKVDAAYKEAYNTTLPVWQKEVLNQMYGVYKESKEKLELPRTLDINGTVYRKSIQIKDFSKDHLDSLIEGSRAFTRKFDNEWLYKPPTKREEMWAEIFALHKESDVIIKVKKEDINAFLHEIENKIPEITWYSGVKIFETKYTIGDIYEELKTCDAIYFRLHKRNKLSYTSDSHIYPYRELKCIDYLPPMRWDLFKKGRIAVKVNHNNYKEFRDTCERELGKKPSTYLWDNVTISICKKDGNFEIFTIEHQKKTGRKIVNWEDVR